MSSYDKVVKLACKPKAAPPKAKYIDTIIAATYSEDGAVGDVCKALSPRFKEPNAIIVFKALIVLHTMIRNGATDNVLSYLSGSDVLRLRNVSNGQWEGYAAPQNLSNYALYLDSRIRAYRDLKHDAVRVQSESNRDLRVSTMEEDPRLRSNAPQRSKTIAGRKLRVMTVEKGLLRETKVVQKMIDALLECKFYLDDLEDELTLTALRILVKDLLVLFQAGNEGVINVLEHYFEMSHIDAEQALQIYRHFCQQAERVVEYLGIARKLQNLLNVPIPNLRHAPVSLVTSLEEYLNDPNFEQNRIEYRTQKALADSKLPLKSALKKDTKKSTEAAKVDKPKEETRPSSSGNAAATGSGTASTSTSANGAKPDANQAMMDFFSSIVQEQTTVFNPQTGSPTSNQFNQQATFNPFVQRQSVFVQQQSMMMPQMTGAFSPMNQGSPFVQVQPTGFPPQTSPFPPTPQQNNLLQPQQQPFLQPQPTQFLQPQPTGSNPFRQSMLLPQNTAFSPFALNPTSGPSSSPNPFGALANKQPFQPPAQPHSAQGSFPFLSQPPPSQFPASGPASPAAQIARPASTPIASSGPSFGQTMTSVATHQTGSKNPFGQPVANIPPVPKPPTLQQLASGAFGNTGMFNNTTGNANGQPQQSTPFGGPTNGPGAPFNIPNKDLLTGPTTQAGNSVINGTTVNGTTPDGKGQAAQTSPSPFGGMSSIASSFAFSQSGTTALNSATSSSGSPPLLAQNTSATTTSSMSDALSNLSLGTNTPSVLSSATSPSVTANPLKPQTTGFGGIKPFKPTSSFGATLLESLPPVPQGSVPSTSGNETTANGAPSLSPSSGPGLGPQPTGAGALNANSISLSPFANSGLGSGLGKSGQGPNLFGGGLRPQITGSGANPFRASMMMTGNGSPFGNGIGGTTPTPNSLSPFPSLNSTPSFGGFGASLSTPNLGNAFGSSSFGSGLSQPTDTNKQQQNQFASLI